MALSYDKQVKIFTNAITGGPVPPDETDEERAYREQAEREVKEAAEQGTQLDLPCDWEDNQPSMT